MFFPSSLVFSSWKGTHVGLNAAVERGPSQGARSGSTRPTRVAFQESPISHTSLKRSGQAALPARIGRAPFHRARSASKKDTWPHLFPSFFSFHSSWGRPPIVLYCARRTRPFRGRAFREQRGHWRSPPLLLQACSFSPQGMGSD